MSERSDMHFFHIIFANIRNKNLTLISSCPKRMFFSLKLSYELSFTETLYLEEGVALCIYPSFSLPTHYFQVRAAACP